MAVLSITMYEGAGKFDGINKAADMIARSAVTMQDIADNVARFRKLYTEGNLCPLCQGDRIHRFSHSDGDSVSEVWMLCPVCCGQGVICLD